MITLSREHNHEYGSIRSTGHGFVVQPFQGRNGPNEGDRLLLKVLRTYRRTGKARFSRSTVDV
jgi:hypothetical protein